MVDIKSLIIGQQVYLLKDVGDAPDGDSPGCLCARFGDKVFVRNVNLTNYVC